MVKAAMADSRQSPLMQRLFRNYPQLAGDAHPDWLAILGRARLAEMPADISLLTAGMPCSDLVLLLDGTLRIFQNTDDGREMTLYRIHPGDVCLMSLSSLVDGSPFRANVTSETPFTGLLISAADFHAALGVSPAFRRMVLSSLVSSVNDMMATFYDTAFQTLDMRLACLLGRLFERAGSETLNITHQDLALELGTSREVVSRLLKKLENQRCVVLSRGQIRLGENRELPGSKLS